MPPEAVLVRRTSPEQRLRHLQAVNRSIVGELTLSGVLRRIVDAAREVAGAAYAALGVTGVDGELEQFIHTGLTTERVEAIEDLPNGRDIYYALVANPNSLRISGDRLSPVVSEDEPPRTAFLSVPIRSRNREFGNLYLTNADDSEEFTVEDTELVSALAATAGIAIENARLYEESRLSQEWLRASGEISRQLLSFEGDQDDVLRSIVTSMERLASADVVALVFPVPDHPDDLEVVVSSGVGSDQLAGLRYPKAGSVAGQVMAEGKGVIIDAVAERADFQQVREIVPVSQVMALPLQTNQGSRGAVIMGRMSNQLAFTKSTLDMAEAFAVQATIVLGLAESRADHQRLSVLEDRDRIARDLHDHVIQRLFAAGMSLESMAGAVTDPGVRLRLVRTVDDLDDTIRQIRSSIFALQDSRADTASVRTTVMKVIDQVSPLLGFRPRARLNGPLDTLADEDIVADVEAVLRESLTNVAKHAQASLVLVDVTADATQLGVTISDDGIGLTYPDRNSGLRNLYERATLRGGTLTLTNRTEGGLRLEWLIPLTP
jgi:signal transduction histidine kinase